MLRFKQFISSYLTEAKAEHFAHIGLDINDPHHKDMLDMFNKHTHMMPKKNPNQYKSLEELHDAVKPHLDELTRQREDEHQQQQALQNGDAELVHHDPETGVKVFKVKSGKGCRAVGSDTKWCTADSGTGDIAFRSYDPEGKHSYVIHTPEKGNLSKIGIIGVKPGEKHKSDLGGNFQDKGNVTVTDKDWELLRKKYNLDSVRALHRIRGLSNPDIEKENKEKSDELLQKIKQSGVDADDIIPHLDDAITNGYLNTEHVNMTANIHGWPALQYISDKSNDPDIHRAIVNHKNADKDTLNKILIKQQDNPEFHRAIVNHKNADNDTLAIVAQKSEDPDIHRAIVNHENANAQALAYVARKSEDPDIHRAIVNHKNVGRLVLQYVAYNSNDPDIHRAIVNHENADDDTLSFVARKSEDPDIHRAIVNHKNADHTLAIVASKSNNPDIHRAIVNHENAGDNALGFIASKSNDPDIHRAIVNHKNARRIASSYVAQKYQTNANKEDISKAIDDHIKNQKNNPYQIESTENIYKTIKNILTGE